MEAGELLKLTLPLIGDIKSGGMLSLGCPDTFWDHILRSSLQPVEQEALLSRFRRGEVVRHRFCRAGRRDVLRAYRSEGLSPHVLGRLYLQVRLG